jgi:Ca-activated chloride channel family protein
MHISAHLDVDLVPLETEDQVSVLIELKAPPASQDPGARRANTLQVVLDRSGSMSGPRLEGAKLALQRLVDRLDPTDNFGVVVFDDQVETTIPAGPLADKNAVRQAIAGIFARGSTDLSGGYLRGLQEARRVSGPAGATVLLVSDGHANAGVVDPEQLSQVAAQAHEHNVTTSTLGFGLGYDERIMSALARGGAGNELFAEEPDTALGLIAGEVEGLLAQIAQAASLSIRLTPHVRTVEVVNDLPVSAAGQSVQVELGSFYGDETRKLLLILHVPGIPALGLAQVATLEFTYVELPALKQHTITVPMHVNVVPADSAAGRVPDPTVRTELVYLQVQRAKRRASGYLTQGDAASALSEIRQARDAVSEALATAPPELAADLTEEAQSLAYLQTETEQGDARRAAKYSSYDASFKSRQRGRQQFQPPTATFEATGPSRSAGPPPTAEPPDATDPPSARPR